MAYQGSRVGVCAESGELVLLDLETGREIARHVIAQDKGTVIRNNDHYRDKAARVADLEATIGEQVGETVGARRAPGSRPPAHASTRINWTPSGDC